MEVQIRREEWWARVVVGGVETSELESSAKKRVASLGCREKGRVGMTEMMMTFCAASKTKKGKQSPVLEEPCETPGGLR